VTAAPHVQLVGDESVAAAPAPPAPPAAAVQAHRGVGRSVVVFIGLAPDGSSPLQLHVDVDEYSRSEIEAMARWVEERAAGAGEGPRLEVP
jgi:hypothetical protein